MAYLGAFHFLHSLNLADCYKVNSAALWPVTGMVYFSCAITTSLLLRRDKKNCILFNLMPGIVNIA